MAGHKLDRVSEDIKRELTDILRQIKDPRVTGLLSVVRVEVTADYSYTKVYVSSLEGIESTKRSVEGLKSASGFVRRELGNRLKLRKSPELIFVADNSIETSAEINKILDGIKEAGHGE